MKDNAQLVPSAYNIAQQSRGGRKYVLFNAVSTALLCVDPPGFEMLEDIFPAPLLEDRPVRAPLDIWANGRMARQVELPESIHRTLRDGGFLVPKSLNELDYIKTRCRISRMRAPIRFVIAPTLDCNLNCFYCFETKSKEKMSKEVQDSVASFVASRLKSSGPSALSVEWYGGEPLLALDAIQYLSGRLKSLCDTWGLEYRAALVTNGTLLTRETVGILRECGVRNYHVTLDGPAEVHDARRLPARRVARARSGDAAKVSLARRRANVGPAEVHDTGQPPTDGRTELHAAWSGSADGAPHSFESIVDNIETAVKEGRVSVRLNVGRSNRDAVGSFLQFTRERGWSERGIEVYPAPIFGTAAPCMGYPDESLPEEEFDSVLDEFCEAGFDGTGANLAEVVGFPPSRHYACEALAFNSFAVSPSGSLFKCPLDIDDERKAVGSVSRPLDLHNVNLLRWLSFDPLTTGECRDCLFLPLCFGGCPKKLFEEGDSGRRSACRFWSKRFSSLLSLAAGQHSQSIFVA